MPLKIPRSLECNGRLAPPPAPPPSPHPTPAAPRLQTEVRRRCSDDIDVIVMSNTNGSLSQGYMLPTPAPAPNSYQHKIAVVGDGGLEMAVDAAVAQINEWVYA